MDELVAVTLKLLEEVTALDEVVDVRLGVVKTVVLLEVVVVVEVVDVEEEDEVEVDVAVGTPTSPVKRV